MSDFYWFVGGLSSAAVGNRVYRKEPADEVNRIGILQDTQTPGLVRRSADGGNRTASITRRASRLINDVDDWMSNPKCSRGPQQAA